MTDHATAHALLNAVQESFVTTADPRLRSILQALVKHLHHFVDEVKLTHAEWHQGVEFLTAVGKACTTDRQEFMLLSDVLGISSAVDIANDSHPAATPGTVLGPYHLVDSPPRDIGASLIDSEDGGEHLRVSGTIRSIDGRAIPGALLDIWSCASNGLYPAQDPTQPPTNLRGLMNADGSGRFDFVVLRPKNYSIPMDGPVGDLMRATARSPIRAAHVHLIVSAPGHRAITTHLFDRECPFVGRDCVFSTRAALIKEFTRSADGGLSARFDVSLTPIPALASNELSDR